MLEELKRRRFMYPHFIEGVITGKFRKLPLAEIRKLVQEHYFGYQPLTQLSDKERALLENLLVKGLDKRLNREDMGLLCGPIYIHEDNDPYFINLYVEGKTPNSPGKLRLLSAEEKVALFFDPNKWLRIHMYQEWGSSGVTCYGNRELLDRDGYFGSADEFRDLLKQVRLKSNTEHLAVLDIGCGMGLALQDMKEIDPDIETHGLTMEQEPAMFSADHFHYMAAERMPIEFKGKFHLIVSNISFRYFLFQHIALRNVVKALANGGYATIAFSYERIPETPESRAYFLSQVPVARSNYDAMKVLVRGVVSELEIAQKEGRLKFITSESFYEYGMQGSISIEKISE